jgi:predicted kinase
MKKVLLVAGNLAALKSTISTKLSKDLNSIVFNKDTIKEVLGDTIGFSNREDNLKLSYATFKLMKKLALDVLSIDDCVILESNFKPIELAELFHLCQIHGFRVFTLMLTGDPEVLYQRYLSRDLERHPVHRSTGLISYEVFERSMMLYDELIYGEESLEVDTTTFDDSNYLNVLTTVKEWMTSLNEK